MKADPQGTKFEQLKPAKESLWYRVALHWIGNILVLVIAFIFGGAFYFVIPLVIFAGYIVFGILKGLWWVVSYPFRKAKERKEAEAYHAYLSSQTVRSRSSQSSLLDNEPETEIDETDSDHESFDDTVDGHHMDFFCSKCGHKYHLPSRLRGKTIKCVSCQRTISVPWE